jgi:hypothetical protein
VTFGDD